MENNKSKGEEGEAPTTIKNLIWVRKNWKNHKLIILFSMLIATPFLFLEVDKLFLNNKYKNKVTSYISSFGTCKEGYNYISGRIIYMENNKTLNIDDLKLKFEGVKETSCNGNIIAKDVKGEVFDKKTETCSLNNKIKFFLDSSSLYILGDTYESSICSDTVTINVYDK